MRLSHDNVSWDKLNTYYKHYRLKTKKNYVIDLTINYHEIISNGRLAGENGGERKEGRQGAVSNGWLAASD